MIGNLKEKLRDLAAMRRGRASRPPLESHRVVCLETGEAYENAATAAREAGTAKSGILNCMEGSQLTAGGFHWVPEGSELTVELIEAGRKLKRREARRVVCLETGEVFKSPKEAAQAVGLRDSRSICSCLNGRAMSAGGRHWAPEGSDLTIERIEAGRKGGGKRVVCIETGVVYESLATAAKAVGLKNSASLSNCLRGKAMTAGGFHWAYADGDPD